MAVVYGGPWSGDEIAGFLEAAQLPLRLSVVGADDYPRVVSVWYRYEREKLWCVTHRSSSLARLLGANTRVGFEISADAPPYCGVRGQGDVVLRPLGTDPTLEKLLMRYIGDLDSSFSQWLLSRQAEELLIEISPVRFFSWDYRARMSRED